MRAALPGEQSAPAPAPQPLARVGRIIGTTPDAVLVSIPGLAGTRLVQARAITSVGADCIGADALLVFDGGDIDRPIVLGVIGPPSGPPGLRTTVEADGARVCVEAPTELVLKCGKAEIRLTQDGRITLSGTHLVSRSLGVNRVVGATVELN